MAASCYLQPIDCDVSTLFETFDSSELPADPGIWHQPLPAAANLLAEGRGTAPRLQKQQQQGRCQSVAIPALAKRNGRRSSSKDKHMSGYKKNCLAISRMEQELTAKLLQAQHLEADKARLQAEHQVLHECCEGLQQLRLQRGLQDFASGEELVLLQQLQSIPCSSSSACGTALSGNSGNSRSSGNSMGSDSSDAARRSMDAAGSPCTAAAADPAAAPAVDGGDSTEQHFSPPNDVMYYYRQLLSLPPRPGADTVTVQELLAGYASMVQQLALQLHLLRQPASCWQGSQEPSLQKIRRLMHEHNHMLASVVLMQRSEVMWRFGNSNFETGELEEETDMQKHAWVLQQLQLTPQQTSNIVRSMSCFKRLLTPLVQQRQLLQQQLAQQHDEPGSGSSSSSVDAYKQCMAQREAMLLRLVNLMRKDNMLRMASATAVAGSLTYVQLATAAVQATPRPLALGAIGMLVLEQHQQQEQQQQRQPAQQS